MKALSFLTVVFFFFAGHASADVKQQLIGLTEEQILFCAGIPAAQMKSGQTKIFLYADTKQVGAITGTGNIAAFSTFTKGCQAQVIMKKGKVVDVLLKTRGLISGPMACKRIFSGCGG